MSKHPLTRHVSYHAPRECQSCANVGKRECGDAKPEYFCCISLSKQYAKEILRRPAGKAEAEWRMAQQVHKRGTCTQWSKP